jgi:hypothetical protein
MPVLREEAITTSQNVCSQAKPRKWNLPLTYAPKIEAVKAGTCTQTIRVIGKAGPKRAGDLISLHGYVNGRGTPWTWRTSYKEITSAETIIISHKGVHWMDPPANCGWSDPWLDQIAALDGIVPPTGEALRDVLISKNGKIPPEGIEAQIIRWDPAPLKEAAHV